MRVILNRNLHRLDRSMPWLPVLGAVIYLTLWIVAEAGRYPLAANVVVFSVFAIAIALSARLPLVSLGLLVVVPVLQFVGVLYPPTANAWPVYEAAGIVALVIGFRGTGLARKLVLPVGAVTAMLFAARMVVPSEQAGEWFSWVGGGNYNYIALGLGIAFSPGDFITLTLFWMAVFAACWLLGFACRSLLREEVMQEQLAESDFELRLTQDRDRISRDVHDALAHSLAVIVAQAEGALALTSRRPAAAGESLRNIADVGRTALVDVRGLVERIHDQDVVAVNPTTADLQALVDGMSATGMDATLRTLGTPSTLAASHELAVFRIVQESLTNALKHGGAASTATVTLDWRGPGVAILVVSRGGKGGDLPAGRGVGIEGMKERARLAGGWLTAEPADDGSFIVTAFVASSEGKPADG